MIRVRRSKIDLDEVVRLRKLGYAQKEIAGRMEVTQQAISYVLLQRRDRNKEEDEVGVAI